MLRRYLITVNNFVLFLCWQSIIQVHQYALHARKEFATRGQIIGRLTAEREGLKEKLEAVREIGAEQAEHVNQMTQRALEMERLCDQIDEETKKTNSEAEEEERNNPKILQEEIQICDIKIDDLKMEIKAMDESLMVMAVREKKAGRKFMLRLKSGWLGSFRLGTLGIGMWLNGRKNTKMKDIPEQRTSFSATTGRKKSLMLPLKVHLEKGCWRTG